MLKQKTNLDDRTPERIRKDGTVNKKSQSTNRNQKRESSKINSLKRHIEKTIYPPRPTRKKSSKKKKQNKI